MVVARLGSGLGLFVEADQGPSFAEKFAAVFLQVRTMLFGFANAVVPAFVRFTPPSARAATTLRVSRPPRL